MDRNVEASLSQPVAGGMHAVAARGEPAPRTHYLDNLRAGAMLLGVLLHAAFAYAEPAQSLWLATDTGSSLILDATIWWIHLFRLSLFFLLSGYFAKSLIERRGVAAFVRGRLLRIALPFALFYPVLRFAFGLVLAFGLAYLPNASGLLGWIREASRADWSETPASGPGTMHLWFLYYLLFFSMLAAVVAWRPWSRSGSAVSPAAGTPPADSGRLERPNQFPGGGGRNWRWCCAAPLLLVPGVLLAGVPLPAPESFVPQLWPFAFYGLYYWAGWSLWGREMWLARWDSHRHGLLACSILLFVPYYLGLPVLDLRMLEAGTAGNVAKSGWSESLLTAYLSASWTMVALLYGRRYCSRRNSQLKFLADASYWVYLVHLPIVLFLQILLVPLPCNVWLKLAMVLTGTVLFSMATYIVFVRYTPLGWLLHGPRQFP